MALFNGYGQINTTSVSGASFTGLHAADGSINIVTNAGSVYTGLYHPCGAFNAVVTTTPNTPYASNGSISIVQDSSGTSPSGFVLAEPQGDVFLPAAFRSNYPDIYFNFTGNSSWSKLGGVKTATSLLTLTNGGGMAADTSGNWFSFPANTPRITNQGLLIEESRTNLNTFSQNFGNGQWAASNINLQAGFASPDGGTNAWMITDNVLNNQHALSNGGVTITASSTYTLSIFLKPTGVSNVIKLTAANAGFTNSYSASFTLTGAGSAATSIVGSGTVSYATITAFPNGWYWCSVTGALAVGDTTLKPTIYLNNSSSYVGTGLSVMLWQCQLELGASATSPIVTNGSTVNRTFETITMTATPTFGSSYSSWAQALPIAPEAYYNPNPGGYINVGDGTNNNRACIRNGGGFGVLINVVAGTTTANISAGTITGLNKVAGSFAAGAQAVSCNGSAVTTATAVAIPAVTVVTLGEASTNGQWLNGYLTQGAIWYSQALSNSYLQTIST